MEFRPDACSCTAACTGMLRDVVSTSSRLDRDPGCREDGEIFRILKGSFIHTVKIVDDQKIGGDAGTILIKEISCKKWRGLKKVRKERCCGIKTLKSYPLREFGIFL